MRARLRRWALVAAVVLGVAGLVAASGVVPIGAAGGHWAVTSWLLKFAMRRSVATHALAVGAAPDLEDAGRVLRGAAHFAGGCAFCHGAPGRPMPRVAAMMTPRPPSLPEVVAELSPAELFYVVERGVKFTGMPAWRSPHRADEVWAVVAFLRTLPSLEPAAYRAQVEPPEDADAPPIVARVCARCHGADGQGRGGAFPRLAGQREAYLDASLRAYAGGERPSGMMEPLAAPLSDAERRAAARHYATRPPMRGDAHTGSTLGATLGARVAREGVPERKLPACAACHGPAEHPHREDYPRLAGQAAWYLTDQLRLFRRGHRGGTPYAALMQTVAAHDLTDAEIAAVAAHYAGLPP
ncbi:MAG: c-type cytochrome [Myxococcales bacterium]|nr:c-type cytochrome [Myxococcales bacterium]